MHFIATSSFPMTDEQVIDLIAAKRGPEHVNAPAYRVMRRIDPDVVEAVCLLQEKAADRMSDWYRDDYMKAGDNVAKHGGRLIDWQSMALESWLEHSKKSARAAACARKLMGIE